MPDSDPDLRASLALAYRHFHAPSTSDGEQDALLRTMVKHLSPAEAEEASRSLYHREQERKHQMTLSEMLDGIGAKPSNGDPANS